MCIKDITSTCSKDSPNKDTYVQLKVLTYAKIMLALHHVIPLIYSKTLK